MSLAAEGHERGLEDTHGPLSSAKAAGSKFHNTGQTQRCPQRACLAMGTGDKAGREGPGKGFEIHFSLWLVGAHP
jgi:hypothetical protein